MSTLKEKLIKAAASNGDLAMDSVLRAKYSDLNEVVSSMAGDANLLDMMSYRSFRNGNRFEQTALSEAEKEAKKLPATKGYPFDVFASEMWMSLYNGRDTMSTTAVAEIHGEAFEWNDVHGKVLSTIQQTDSFKELRDITAGDAVMTSVAVSAMSSELLQAYVEAIPEQDDQQQDQNGGGKEGSQPQQSMQQALQKAKDACDDADQSLKSAGIEPPQDDAMDPTEYMDLAEKLASEPRLVALMDQVGRALGHASRLMANSVTATAGHGSAFSFGGDVDRLAHYLFADLAHPLLRRQLMGEIAADEAVMVADEDFTRDRKGPVVIAADESGSMDGQQGIDAKAIAIATHVVARREGRDTRLISFSSRSRVYDPSDPKQLYAFMTSKMGGGTSFNSVVDSAMEVVDKSGIYGADLLMVTDGEDVLCEERHAVLLKRKQEGGLRLFVTFITCGGAQDGDEHANVESHIKNAGMEGVLSGYSYIPAGKLLEKGADLVWRSIEGKSL